MVQVTLDDRVFKVAQRHAADAGYTSVDEYIADFVVHETPDGSDDLDHLFTSERIADLDQISTEIRSGGKTYTVHEVEDHFESKRNAWLANHAS